MVDYDLFIRFKDITKAKTAIEMAKMLDIKHSYISRVKKKQVALSAKTARKMYLIAGDEIAIMWGRLQEEKIKKG